VYPKDRGTGIGFFHPIRELDSNVGFPKYFHEPLSLLDVSRAWEETHTQNHPDPKELHGLDSFPDF
jgi:hypothetical protein